MRVHDDVNPHQVHELAALGAPEKVKSYSFSTEDTERINWICS